ncbi:hypothetical protein Mgra_00009406 [Meloidogyne graminicola]|uniref:Uncharacterized protein n=1 Tax=Meloidogyne graminicola TaxID=189291 RepID=A0A8S9Z7W7_9BILA|nr:hypothetical protein Mgra_00009406 [Meloidogyne graminicola]
MNFINKIGSLNQERHSLCLKGERRGLGMDFFSNFDIFYFETSLVSYCLTQLFINILSIYNMKFNLTFHYTFYDYYSLIWPNNTNTNVFWFCYFLLL